MKVKFASDFHTEFWSLGNENKFERILEHYFPECPDDKETVLCCSGDMGTYSTYANSYKPLIAILSKRFKHVIMVPGNHSWYNSAGVWGNEEFLWDNRKLPKNVSYLDNGFKIINDVIFIGSCLWTSFNDLNQIAMFTAGRGMNDFVCIKKRNYEVDGVYGTLISSSKLQPEDTVARHYQSVEYIKDVLSRFPDNKSVIITHHAPSSLSIDTKYQGDTLNAAYYTDLSNLILDHKPLYWSHGHMHSSFDYNIGDTRVICNPLGYHAVEINKKFNPDLVVEV